MDLARMYRALNAINGGKGRWNDQVGESNVGSDHK